MSLSPVMPDVEQAQGQPELSPEARKALEGLVTSCLGDEKSARRAEVRKAWQQRNFSNGFQYLWWDQGSNTYMTPEASGNALPRFMDVYNIYTPHKRSFVSILSQNPPGINFVPNDLQRSVDVTAASYGEKMRHRVDRLVHMKDRQSEAAGYFCTDGRTIIWSRIDAKGKLRCTVHGVLESKVPIYARKMERWGYAVLSEEVDIWEAKDEFPDFADDIKAETDNSESAYERYARLGILANNKGAAGQADALKGITTEHNCWIRPSRYRKTADKVRNELKTLYPDGVRVTMISGKAVNCIAESMDSALKVEWPSPGQGSSRPSMLQDLVPIQIAFNDHLNMLRTHIDFSIPARWVTDTVDSEALNEQVSAPGVIHTITVPNGASITDLVHQEDVAQLPPELVQNIDRLLSLAQFVTGDLPSLSGEGDPHSETAEGQKMLSDQAKGQLSTAWGGMQWLFAGTYEIEVKLAAQLDSDKASISVQGGKGQDSFSPGAILDGEFGCYPNTDSSFPETMADQRASLQSVLSQLGQAGQAGQAIVMHPANLKLVKQMSGLKDLYIAQAAARDKQLREIEQMLKEPLLPPDPQRNPQAAAAYDQAMQQWSAMAAQAQAQGQQPPPRPIVDGMECSIQIGKYDYNQFELDFVIEWLSEEQCFEEIQKGNQQGVQNVTLHADLHQAAVEKLAAANAPKPEPMKISANFADLDAATKVQSLERDGYQPDQSAYEVSTALEHQATAADTQSKAAGAQHSAVLAAKEAATPIQRPMTPEQQLEAKKSGKEKN